MIWLCFSERDGLWGCALQRKTNGSARPLPPALSLPGRLLLLQALPLLRARDERGDTKHSQRRNLTNGPQLGTVSGGDQE